MIKLFYLLNLIAESKILNAKLHGFEVAAGVVYTQLV